MIKVLFTDLWPGFTPENFFFYDLLSRHYPVKLVDSNPDLVIHSCFGNKHTKHNAVRIYYSGENKPGNLVHSDYLIGFGREENKRQIRYPIFLLYDDFNKISVRLPTTVARDFCSFVASNSLAPERTRMFNLLSKSKTVASGGRYLNNIGGPVADKREFIKKHNFNLAFENESAPGYCTEKIVDAFAAHTIPIYWGDPTVLSDFRQKSFINTHDYLSFEDVVADVLKIHQNPELLQQILNEKPMFDPVAFKADHDEKLLRLFKSAIDESTKKNNTHSPFRNVALPQIPNRLQRLLSTRKLVFVIKNTTIYRFVSRMFGCFSIRF